MRKSTWDDLLKNGSELQDEDGTPIRLIEPAYAHANGGYAAAAITKESFDDAPDRDLRGWATHYIYWEITNPDCEDEADACDWDDYTISPV